MKMQADLMIRDGDFLNEEFELEKGKSISKASSQCRSSRNASSE